MTLETYRQFALSQEGWFTQSHFRAISRNLTDEPHLHFDRCRNALNQLKRAGRLERRVIGHNHYEYRVIHENHTRRDHP